MDPETTNYLYRHPQLYDSVFRNAPTGPRLTAMSLALLQKNGAEPPSTVLDIGFGTGFKLAHLQQAGYVGDVRSLRLGRTFDVITCLGWVVEVENDVARFRLFFPMELEHYLGTHGFDVLDMYDNTDLTGTDLDGSMLYVTARYRGDLSSGEIRS